MSSRRVLVTFVAMASGIGMIGCSSSSNDSKSTTKSGGGDVTVPAATGTPVAVTALDVSKTSRKFDLAPASVKAGQVTFTFVNDGDRQHEMVVLKTDTPFDQLVVGTDYTVAEDDSVGEIPETDAGQTVVKNFDLEPGNYVLVCNIVQHYEQGMRVAFTVTP